MGREEGGGFRMGNTCMPVADSFLYMTEPINIVKFKKKKGNKQKNVTDTLRESLFSQYYDYSYHLKYRLIHNNNYKSNSP